MAAVGAERPPGLPDFQRDFATIAEFLDWWLRNPVLPEPHATVFNRYYAGYRRRFGAYVRHHYTDQTREIGTLIRERTAPRLLEVGAGCGTEALWFALQGARVLAIDVNAERLAAARARQEVVEKALGRKLDLDFRFCSLFDLDAEAAFDLIWMEQAFHHIEPREELYPKVARLLARGGHVVISEANGWNLPLQARLFLQRGFKTIVERTTAEGERILYGNERITIPPVMVRGFEKQGVAAQSVRYFRVLPNLAVADRLMGLERLVPGFAAPLYSHYNYIGRKA